MIILLCEHNDRRGLNIQEIGWLETLCSYADLLLECSYQVEESESVANDNEPKQPPMWLSKVLFNLSEKSGQIWQVIFMMVYYRTKYACLEN